MQSSAPQLPMTFLNVPPAQSSPKRWSELFTAAHVENEDKLWSDYLTKADAFDKRLVEDWNKIVDVILIYVALFLSVLNTFVVDSSMNLKPDPADISNKLLNATYHMMAAHYTNTTIHLADTTEFFTLPSEAYNTAVICNALLYTSIALCTVVSVISLAAKLWLVAYSDRTFNLVGIPYDRSVERQKAYNGVVAWKMGAVINTMPLLLLMAVIMFGFYIHISVFELNTTISYAVAIVIILGFVTLAITSLAAAFVPECPFYSPFSAIVKFVFEFPGKSYRKLRGYHGPQKDEHHLSWLMLSIALCIVSGGVIAYFTLTYSFNILSLVFIPLTITFQFAMKEVKGERKPQKYMLPYWAVLGFVIIGSIMSAAGYFTAPQNRNVFITLYSVGMVILFFVGLVARNLAKSTEKTKDIDAIAWLLNSESTPSEIRSLLLRIGQMTDKSNKHYDYRPRLLDSLMPLLSSLITSPRTKMLYDRDESDQDDLTMYVSCLAQLSNFDDDPWSWHFWKRDTRKMLRSLHEDAKKHPILEDSLRKKLEELIKDPKSKSELIDAAKAVLISYSSDEQREELLRELKVSGDTSSTTTLTEPGNTGYEARSRRRRWNGYDMLGVAGHRIRQDRFGA